MGVLVAALLHRPLRFCAASCSNGWLPCSYCLTVAIFAGIIGFIALRIEGSAGFLFAQTLQVFDRVGSLLHHLPGAGGGSTGLVDNIQTWVDSHFSNLLLVALSAGRSIVELAVGLVLTLLLSLLFLLDGERQWGWLVRMLPSGARSVVKGAGQRAFSVLGGWIGGTAIIAVIHAVVIGAAMWLLGPPLVIALALVGVLQGKPSPYIRPTARI